MYSTNLLIYLFRLLDLVNRRNVVFSNIQFYVLDEADRMLDMGFGPDINKCMIHPTMPTKENRNTLMFSATFPEDVRTNARKYLREVRLGHSFTSQQRLNFWMLYKTYKQHNYDFENTCSVLKLDKKKKQGTGKIICSQKVV